ncbi:hypothetical protein HDV03_005042 [Kappamyces sp. JEL0829]|nr:hypothetical protein HDV03_005042 [Kappamyces sp. JEL0829]
MSSSDDGNEHVTTTHLLVTVAKPLERLVVDANHRLDPTLLERACRAELSQDPSLVILGLFSARLGLPLKPTLRDKALIASFCDRSTVPLVLGIFHILQDQSHLFVQDFGFYTHPRLASPGTDATDGDDWQPALCKVKILNLAPIVPPPTDLLPGTGSEALAEKQMLATTFGGLLDSMDRVRAMSAAASPDQVAGLAKLSMAL